MDFSFISSLHSSISRRITGFRVVEMESLLSSGGAGCDLMHFAREATEIEERLVRFLALVVLPLGPSPEARLGASRFPVISGSSSNLVYQSRSLFQRHSPLDVLAVHDAENLAFAGQLAPPDQDGEAQLAGGTQGRGRSSGFTIAEKSRNHKRKQRRASP